MRHPYITESTASGYIRHRAPTCPLSRISCVTKPFHRCEYLSCRSYHKDKVPAHAMVCKLEPLQTIGLLTEILEQAMTYIAEGEYDEGVLYAPTTFKVEVNNLVQFVHNVYQV